MPWRLYPSLLSEYQISFIDSEKYHKYGGFHEVYTVYYVKAKYILYILGLLHKSLTIGPTFQKVGPDNFTVNKQGTTSPSVVFWFS